MKPAIPRLLALILLLALAASAIYFLLGTPTGRHLRSPHHLREHREQTHQWVHRHPITAPAALIASYIVLGVLALPLWWLQILAGYCFGPWLGISWCVIGATLAAVCASGVSRWIGADWFHQKIESHMAKLRKLDQTMGHNGLLVVMTVRLCHLLPFGLSNYLLGLTTISLRDVAVGTFLGGTPAVCIYVLLGAGRHYLTNWKFMSGLVTLNILLLCPVIVRYLRPDWFRKVGLE
jgi:uncharacterized membrane protein YdjX (TVP38/TMEM64 family)